MFSTDIKLSPNSISFDRWQYIGILLRDLPDTEIIGYGTPEMIEQFFDGDATPTEEEILQAREDTDKMFKSIYDSFDIIQIYWDLNTCQYVMNFN